MPGRGDVIVVDGTWRSFSSREDEVADGLARPHSFDRFDREIANTIGAFKTLNFGSRQTCKDGLFLSRFRTSPVNFVAGL